MKLNPLISVIVNCYNGEKFLHNCINSILNQTYKNFEIIFWNNKSEDNSLNLIKQFKDSRIKVFNSKTHTNLSKARNYALKKTWEIYMFFGY